MSQIQTTCKQLVDWTYHYFQFSPHQVSSYSTWKVPSSTKGKKPCGTHTVMQVTSVANPPSILFYKRNRSILSWGLFGSSPSLFIPLSFSNKLSRGTLLKITCLFITNLTIRGLCWHHYLLPHANPSFRNVK